MKLSARELVHCVVKVLPGRVAGYMGLGLLVALHTADNHATTQFFYRPDALPATQPIPSTITQYFFGTCTELHQCHGIENRERDAFNGLFFRDYPGEPVQER